MKSCYLLVFVSAITVRDRLSDGCLIGGGDGRSVVIVLLPFWNLFLIVVPGTCCEGTLDTFHQ